MARNLRTVRSGFTLVEALIAVAVTLIMMLALSQGFVMMSQSISEGRAKLTLSDQLRGISTVLREDLDGMTAGGDPNSESCRIGYFEYYEGPISDYLPALVNFDSTQANLEEKNRAGRYGDFDDILAFTAKAKKGRWFYGEVPYPMVMGPVAMAAGDTTLINQLKTPEAWARSVTVASDTAEIVYFMMPYPADPSQFPLATPTNSQAYVNFVRDDSVVPVSIRGTYVLNGNLTPNVTDVDIASGVPDRMILCRRLLLVKPELNMPKDTMMPDATEITKEPTLFHIGPPLHNSPSRATQLNALPLGAPGSPNVYGYRLGMQMANQRCDLSVRRASDEDLTNVDPITANSLADLQDPKNRFAHTVLPISGTSNTTMPLWSLSGPIPLQTAALTSSTGATDNITTSGQFGLSVTGDGSYPEVGFILPQFMRQRRTDLSTGTDAPEAAIRYEVAFSEVVAANVIGFDVRGFDPSVTQFYHPGVDGTALNADDVIVSPSDPGYANVLNRMWGGTGWIGPAPSTYTARKGGGVNLGWPLTLRASGLIENSQIIAGRVIGTENDWVKSSASRNIATQSQLSSALSLTVPDEDPQRGLWKGVGPFNENFKKSGKVVYDTSNQLRVYQPTFDTYTGRYETDGYEQSGATGTIWIDGQYQYQFPYGQTPYVSPNLPAGNADRGTNGVDDDGINGIDDFLEKDSAPPIASHLKAIQVIIRVEDKGANAIQQVAVDHELRLEN